ncbi:MAG TPA: DUF6335 family protein [Vicinamibacterales bacterium]|jgi:hypothetical protein
MAKRKAATRSKPSKSAKKAAPKRKVSRRGAKKASKRPVKAKASAKKKPLAKVKAKSVKPKPVKAKAVKTKPVKAKALKATAPKVSNKSVAAKPKAVAASKPETKVPHLDRARRTLDETLQTPPSSLDMDRKGSAARSGRAEMAQNARDHRGMSSDITGGDVDVDVEDAYFTGDEAPGGDNPSPDLEVVDDIGKALGVQYDDAEELKSGDKLVERDKHRWEMDPASAEDYKDRD